MKPLPTNNGAATALAKAAARVKQAVADLAKAKENLAKRAIHEERVLQARLILQETGLKHLAVSAAMRMGSANFSQLISGRRPFRDSRWEAFWKAVHELKEEGKA